MSLAMQQPCCAHSQQGITSVALARSAPFADEPTLSGMTSAHVFSRSFALASEPRQSAFLENISLWMPVCLLAWMPMYLLAFKAACV